MTLILQGTTLSPGLATGPVYLRRSRPVRGVAAQDIERHEVEHELSRLDAATSTITDDLLTLATRVEREIDSSLAEVFGAHQLMLSDPSLRVELRREIEENLVCASTAVKTVFLRDSIRRETAPHCPS